MLDYPAGSGMIRGEALSANGSNSELVCKLLVKPLLDNSPWIWRCNPNIAPIQQCCCLARFPKFSLLVRKDLLPLDDHIAYENQQGDIMKDSRMS